MKHSKIIISIIAATAPVFLLAPHAYAQSKFRIKSFRLQNLCFDVANARIANGTPIQVANCKAKDHIAQTWIQGAQMTQNCAIALQECRYQIKLAANPQYCLDYLYSTKAPKDGVGLQLWLCRDSRNGDSAYWGEVLGYSAQASLMYPGVPKVGIFGNFNPSISAQAREGEKIKLRDFTSQETQSNYYRYWVTDF